jgi:hypothetical protein
MWVFVQDGRRSMKDTVTNGKEITIKGRLVDAKKLLELLFAPECRPSLR